MGEGKISQYEIIVESCKKPELETIKMILGERSVYLHSKYDPVSEAERQVKDLVVGADSVYFIFGLGMGYLIRALISKMEEDNRIVVFEPNESVIKAFNANRNNSDLIEDDRIIIAQYLSQYAAGRILAEFYEGLSSVSRNRMFIMPVYKDIYPFECHGFAYGIKNQIFRCALMRNTNEIFADIWFKCTINNIDFLRRSYSSAKMEDLYKNVPAVIVSAGPSLAKNIDLLKELKEKAVIISVDTAYAPLYNRGIVPDYVVSIDAQPIVAYKFANSDIYQQDLLTTYLSATQVQKQHTGRIVAFSEFNHFLDECYDDLGIDMLQIESGGSVACTALDLAYKMGANPIIFIGQDLAHSGGETHIPGTPFYKTADKVTSKTFEVEGINGGKVLTTYNLNGYREWIQMFFNVYGDRTYINATEGGAKIEGAAVMTFREVIDGYCCNSYGLANKKEQVFSESNRTVTKQQYEGFLTHIERAGKYLKRIVKDVDVCVLLTEKIIKEINNYGFKRPEHITTPYQKIKKLNKDLDKNEHLVDIILPLMAIKREDTARTDHLLNKDLTKEQLLSSDLEKYADYYRVFSEKAKYAVPLIEAAVENEKKELRSLAINNLEVWRDE